MYKLIIDANVWIKYARIKDIKPLLDRLHEYQLVPIVDNYLLAEIFDALVNNNWMNPHQAQAVINYIKKISLTLIGNSVYRLSPDPKDNYLFDLAIQNNCVFIITDDTKLLQFSLKPLPVHTSSWFLRKFPVK